MDCIITRQNFHNGLTAVSAGIPTKTTLPVLSNIFFDAVSDGVWMVGTDLDVVIKKWVPAEVKAPGDLTAPGKKLQEIVKELPDQMIGMTSRGDQLELACGKSNFKLNGMPSHEFPELPEVDFSSAWKVKGSDLHSLIKNTSFAVSTEESRPILNGVLWELRDGQMRMVATNGHRLARMGVPAKVEDAPNEDFIVPPLALQQVQRLFDPSDDIEVSNSGNHLGFRTKDTEVYTRLIDGTYPNYEQVLPKDNDKVALVEKNGLASALRRMAVVASDQTRRIRMAFNVSDKGDGSVHLSVLTPDLGEGSDELPLESYEGEGLEIGFNATYFLEVLKYMPTESVKMTFKAPEKAATIEPDPKDSDQGQKDYVCLVMPLRLVD